MVIKEFDLNTMSILKTWKVNHAVRELISNAIDETKIAKCKRENIKYDNDKSLLIIQDYGRGLQTKHLVMNEDIEKTKREDLIGNFGIGLKDSLSVLHGYNKNLEICSKHLKISGIKESSKHDFNDMNTLHVLVEESLNNEMEGTIISICPITKEEYESSIDQFLQYNKYTRIETTKYGDIYNKNENENGNIYVNGVKIATDTQYLYHYNITKVTTILRGALNRDRNSMGKTIYSDRMKAILKNAIKNKKNKEIVDNLFNHYQNKDINPNDLCGEVTYTDIVKLLFEHSERASNIVTVTKKDQDDRQTISEIKSLGYEIAEVPNYIAKELVNSDIKTFKTVSKDIEIKTIRKDIDRQELNSVESENLTKAKNFILKHVNSKIPIIKVQEIDGPICELGHYNPSTEEIYLSRVILNNLEQTLGTLLHEYTHHTSKALDESANFEIGLTNLLGSLALKLINT